MIKQIVTFLFLLYSSSSIAADNFNLYLVRHAEKQANIANPALTACGQQRAKQLATMLAKADIKAIYSTSYNRTMATAKPLALKNNLSIQHYDPRSLSALAKQLRKNKQNVLIVGHSNTTPQLAALLSNKKVATKKQSSHITSSTQKDEAVIFPLSENDYQMLYQIQFINGEVSLTLLQQPLQCSLNKTQSKKAQRKLG